MLQIERDGTIHLTRGDTARLSVKIVDSDGSDYVMAENDILKLTVKKTLQDEAATILKVVTGSNNIHITPLDTKSLSFGKYLYDVQLTTEIGDVYTVLGPATFEIMKEVSD